MDDASWVDSCTLPFLGHRVSREDDPANCAKTISAVVGCSEYVAIDQEQPFCYRTSSFVSGDCAIMSVAHTPIRVATQDHHGHMFVMSEGEGHRARVDSKGYGILPGEAIFIPQQVPSVEVETGNYVGIAFSISDACLRRAIHSFNPLDSCLGDRIEILLNQPILFSPTDPSDKILIEQIKSLISLIDLSIDVNGDLCSGLCFDDLFAARVVTLLCPEGLMHDSLIDYEVTDGRADPCFDDLIDYIRHNLRTPLSLSELSERSGLSRYQLSQAFRHHFGLSPMRWIHGQRIQMLNQMLED